MSNGRIQLAVTALLVLGLLFGGYLYIRGGQTPEGSAGISNQGLSVLGPDANSADELLLTLSSVDTIRLDTSIFSSLVYQSLRDFGLTLSPQAKGRTNPFAPISQGQASRSFSEGLTQ